MASTNFDFIIVGAGPAGCMLATRLARSRSRPSVLLLEAGTSDGSDEESRIPAERFFHWLSAKAKRSSTTWPYKTIPQPHLDDREIPYTRGTGLGGTSAINFSMWTIPPRDWHDDVAEQTGNEQWRWQAARERYTKIETLRAPEPDRYYAPNLVDHGSDGPVRCGIPRVLGDTLTHEMDVWIDAGFPLNKDSNDGDPLGVSVCVNTVADGYKSTAADVLDGAPGNLEIRTGVRVRRVLFDGDATTAVATGVLTSGEDGGDGKIITASKEVILCAGSLDTPRILMHSGIGPAVQLSAFNIPVIRDSPGVGQNLQDHFHAPFSLARDDEATLNSGVPAYYRSSKEAQATALEQWKRDRTGPLTDLSGALGLLTKKLSKVFESPEFHALPPEEQRFLRRPTVAMVEVMLNFPSFGYLMAPDRTRPNQTYVIMVACPQSRGQVTLQSADPEVPLRMSPNLFAHPFDRRVALEATRELLLDRASSVLQSPDYSRHTTAKLVWPAGESDEEILAHWRKAAGSTWHMSGTVRMGRRPEDSCVDARFKVWGADGLRVADLSVVPRLPV